MKTRFQNILLLITIIATASCSSNTEKLVIDNSPTISVKTGNATSEGNKKVISASGKIEATKSANLSTRMMGFVTKVNVNVGESVKKGQMLLSINTSDLQAKLAQVNAKISQATAAFKNAEKDYNRFVILFSQESASQKEMDDMTAHYEMAKAGLEAANQMRNEVNAQFSYANIQAPFNGVITNKFINEGDMANPGMPLLAIEGQGSFEVIAMVPENEIAQIKSGAVVIVHVKSINEKLSGVVSEVSTSAKNTGGQYLVKVTLNSQDAKVLSGMFATVHFSVEGSATSASNILVPTSAIVTNGGLNGIYTISEQNTALLRWLRLGKTYGDKVEVLSGLIDGEKYILSAEGKLSNRAKISIQ